MNGPLAPGRFRLHVSQPADGATNMALDRALLADAVQSGRSWLRLYAFAPPTITLGRAERPEDVLDLARCAADGIGVARRPTGGRAVLHADELTYCLAVPEADPAVGAGREALARFAGEILAAALVTLGIPAETVRTSTALPAAGAYRSCFASASRWEVAVNGRKIVGSAQRRVPGGALQHGSILLGPGFRSLGRYLADDASRPGEIAAAAADLPRAICASEVLGRPVAHEAAAGAVIDALTARTGLPERVELPEHARAAAAGAREPAAAPRVDTVSGAFLYCARHASG